MITAMVLVLAIEVDPIADSVDSVDIMVAVIVRMTVSVFLINNNNNHIYSYHSHLIINHRNSVTIFLQ